MKDLLNAYQCLPKNLQRYLPDAVGVTVESQQSWRFDTMTEMVSFLKDKFDDESVSGWVTLQSKTLLLKSVISWTDVLAQQPLLQGELTTGNRHASLHFAQQQWHLTLTQIARSDAPDTIAVAHTFAVDPLRFPDPSAAADSPPTIEIHYWVLWQLPTGDTQDNTSSPGPVGQFLTGIHCVAAENANTPLNNDTPLIIEGVGHVG